MIGRPKNAALSVILKRDVEVRRTGATKAVEKPKSVKGHEQLAHPVAVNVGRSQFVANSVMDAVEDNAKTRLERDYPIRPVPWSGLLDYQLFVSVAKHRHKRQSNIGAERMPDRIEHADNPAAPSEDCHFVLSIESLYIDSPPLNLDQIAAVRKTTVFGVGDLRSFLFRGGCGRRPAACWSLQS